MFLQPSVSVLKIWDKGCWQWKKPHLSSYLHDLWQETQRVILACCSLTLTIIVPSLPILISFYRPFSQILSLACSLTEQPTPHPISLLDFLKDYFQNQSGDEIDQLLTDAGVYPLQRPVFSSYFQTGQTQRPEELILEELDYEKTRCWGHF